MKALRRRDFLVSSAGALTACMTLPIAAQEPENRAVTRGTPYNFPQSDVRLVTAKSGAEYRILIAWPEQPPPSDGFPILYFLDADNRFAAIAERATHLARFTSMGIWRPGTVPGIVVGIDYPGENRRLYDFTPPGTPSGLAGAVGGADAFLSFIADELRPMIESDFPVDRDRQTLLGGSAGGLFVLHALYTRPELFQTYVAGSPALGFWDEPVLKGEEELGGKLRARGLRRKLIVTVGENEEAVVFGSRRANILNDARNLAERLGRMENDGLQVKLRIFSGEDHYTTHLPLIGEALFQAFAVQR
jgi:predicted alpha/beta superfamily hydrolase